MDVVDFLIIGAGPTGLGAANRLQELGIRNYIILEANSHVGGLSASFKDDAGFTWDTGGHIFFSKYPYVNRLVEELMGGDLITHRREALIYVAGRWIDYPFQNNIRQLPRDVAQECFEGMVSARSMEVIPSNFEEWILTTLGKGVSRVFMHPYNQKVWAHPLSMMGYDWIAERVSIPDVGQLRNVAASGTKAKDWGLNCRFSYPRQGGIGDIFRRLSDRVKGHVLTSHDVTRVNPSSRIVATRNGRKVVYRCLLNTSPLNRFLRELLAPIPSVISDAGVLLKHNSVDVIGVGLDGVMDRKTNWMYFPEAASPFYRVTNLHTYSPHMTPESDRHSALMAEVSYPALKETDHEALREEVLEGMLNVGLLDEKANRHIISRWRKTLNYAYPIPCIERDRALDQIHPYLEERDICSRGRFGGWRYEVGNMDHSIMQGAEWANRMVKGEAEYTYWE